MLEELRNSIKKTAKKRIIAWAIAIVIMMVAPLLAPVRFILGPEDITGKTKLDYSACEGRYVKYEVEYALDYYMEEYSVNSKTGRRNSTNSYGYIVYNYDDNTCFGVWLPSSKDKEMEKRMDAAATLFYEGKKTEGSVTVKGTMRKLSGDSLKYYQESLKSLEEYIPGVTEAAVLYYIDSTSVNYIPIYVIAILYAICFAGLGVILVTLLGLLLDRANKHLKKFLKAHPGVTEDQVDCDMVSAVYINAKNPIWAGRRFTVWKEGTTFKLIDNSKLIWAYYYRVTGKRAVSQTRIYDTDRKMTAINASQDVSEKLLNAYIETQPQIIIGYKAELEKEFKKNFEGFMNLKYNPAQQAEYSRQEEYSPYGESAAADEDYAQTDSGMSQYNE